MKAPRRLNDAVRPALTRAVAFAAAFAAAACTRDFDEPTGPGRLTGKHPTAVVEITFSNIGTPNMRSSALVAADVAELNVLRAARAEHEARASLDLTVPQNSGGGGSASIELNAVASNAVNSAGYRYFQATYNVRNAQSNGAAFDTPRTNLTFLAVSTAATLADTPVNALANSGGAVDPMVARTLQPTGHVTVGGGGELVAVSPDVFQVFSEADVASITAPSGVTNIFPYGFVTRRSGSTATRTLPASPAGGQFDGVVTFAFRIPDTGASTPSTIRVVMLAVDDADTRVTQSVEEQNASDAAAALARATSLGASKFVLLPKSAAFMGGGQEDVICSVRTSGSAGAASSTLFSAPNGEAWLIPSANQAGPRFLPRTARLAAARCPTLSASNQTAFTVHGSQSGRALGPNVAGSSIVHQAAMSGSGYFPGEEIEVSATTALGGTTPIVARYRVASAPASGTFGTPTSFAHAGVPGRIAAADMNRDGKLDLVVADNLTGTISVRFGNGDGTFQAATSVAVGNQPVTIAMGDYNGDGYVDVAVVLETDNTVGVLLNNGAGGLNPVTPYVVGNRPSFVAAGDFNGDGKLDLVVPNFNANTVSVLLGNGNGTFQGQVVYSTGTQPSAVAVGDLNNDGKLDLVVSLYAGGGSVLMGNGNGTFASATSVTMSGGSTTNLALGDINGDGRLDAVFTLPGINCVSIHFGNGDGTFGAGSLFSVAAEPWSVAIVDLDGDGKLDLVTAGTKPTISHAIGNGNGTFQTAQVTTLAGDSSHILAVDLNNDGRLDLISPRYSDNVVYVLLAQP